MLDVIRTGIDIVAIERFSGKIADKAFIKRLLTEREAAEVKAGPRAERRLAVRFAAKEAVMKTLGTGWDKGVGWRDIEIIRTNETGTPDGRGALSVKLHNAAKAVASNRRFFLSVSDTGGFAVAFAAMEGSDEVPDNNPRL